VHSCLVGIPAELPQVCHDVLSCPRVAPALSLASPLPPLSSCVVPDSQTILNGVGDALQLRPGSRPF
jgi:hypothetical protein